MLLCNDNYVLLSRLARKDFQRGQNKKGKKNLAKTGREMRKHFSRPLMASLFGEKVPAGFITARLLEMMYRSI